MYFYQRNQWRKAFKNKTKVQRLLNALGSDGALLQSHRAEFESHNLIRQLREVFHFQPYRELTSPEMAFKCFPKQQSHEIGIGIACALPSIAGVRTWGFKSFWSM